MIIVICFKERDSKTGRIRTVVSHGVDDHTGRTVILPCDTPEDIGAVFDPSIGEYVVQ
jgi:hypothetical protein